MSIKKKIDRKTRSEARSKAPSRNSQNVRYEVTRSEPMYLDSPPVWLGPDDGTQEEPLLPPRVRRQFPTVSYRKPKPTTRTGPGPDAVQRLMRSRGIPETLDNYLKHAGMSRKDLKDAELRETLPPSVRELYDVEDGSRT